MALEEALYSRLQAVSAVTDLVGTRVYAVGKAGKDPAFPYVTYERINTERHSAMTADTGDATAEIRFHAWGITSTNGPGFDSARDVMAAIQSALQRWSGVSASITVKAVFFIDEFDLGEVETGVFHRVGDFRITWTE